MPTRRRKSLETTQLPGLPEKQVRRQNREKGKGEGDRRDGKKKSILHMKLVSHSEKCGKGVALSLLFIAKWAEESRFCFCVHCRPPSVAAVDWLSQSTAGRVTQAFEEKRERDNKRGSLGKLKSEEERREGFTVRTLQ